MTQRQKEIRAPFDGSLIATIDTAGIEEAEQAMTIAHALFRDRDTWLAPSRRIDILRKAARLMEEHAESLALGAAREGGKPLIDSRVEVARAIDGVLGCAELLRSEAGHVIPTDINAASARRIAFTRREPIGVVVAVSAFNRPLNLIVHQAGPAIAAGCPVVAGQVCVSVQRVFAHRSISETLAGRIAEQARSLKVGDPTLPETEIGPLIRRQEVERVDAWVQEAIAGGAELLCGGAPLSASCYAPTVLLEPPTDCRVSTEEVFGPVVCIYAYDDLGRAIARANSLPVALQAAIFTRDYATAMRAYERLDASAVMVNDHTAFRIDWMPFAGLRESGLGVGGIPYTYREMQAEKMFVGPMA